MSAQGVHVFARATLPETAWKNGGGTTREIAVWPHGSSSSDFGWRVSIASIGKDGPFSAFDGVDRIITLLSGGGIRLATADRGIDHKLDVALEPFEFVGEAEVDCVLVGGESSALNVMTRRGQWRARVDVVRSTATLPAASHGVLLALNGTWRLEARLSGGAGRTLALEKDDGLHWSGQACAWELGCDVQNQDSQLIAVNFVKV